MILNYNKLLIEMAKNKQCYYIDLCSYFAGEDGYLPPDAGGDGVHLHNIPQFKKTVADMVEYAHSIGLNVGLRPPPFPGFFDDYRLMPPEFPEVEQINIFPLADPQKADAITSDIELTCDEEGYAEGVSVPVWGRHRFPAIYAEILKAYAFDKTGGDVAEGFYASGSLVDVTDRVVVTSSRTNRICFEVDLGREFAGKTVFVLVAHFYAHHETGEGHWLEHKKFMDDYADVPIDGIMMDEYSYMLLSLEIKSGKVPPFRVRRYNHYMNACYRERWGVDLHKLLFDMRYAPERQDAVRIQAINYYFEKLRVFPLEIEQKVYDYAKKTFGEDTYICCHNTFHNNLDLDEVWHTACNWWDIPRDIGHTDENISYPVRMGVMLANKFPMEIDMYYSKKEQDYFDHMAQGAPFNCREFHHTYMSDGFWGNNFTDPTFLRKIRSCDRKIGMLNDWQTEYPKLDVLVVFGSSAQNNWYPNYENRNVWDIDGSLKIMKKCDQMWNAGYRCALVPDYAIEDGRITLEGDKIAFNGYLFDHCVFMYPKYAKAETYEFLNKAGAAGASVVAVGQANVDFNGNPAELTIPCYEEFNLDILQTMGCPVRIIPDGCVYTDGSFCIVHADGLVEGTPKYFEFELDGVRYNGDCTGVLAYRKDGRVIGTEGTTLFVDGKCIAVENPVKD